MGFLPFDRAKHIYTNDAFAELVKDAVRFLHGTPVQGLSNLESFRGSGVYVLYCTSKVGLYAKYGLLNRLDYSYPIYVGKAVPKGWRQARVSDETGIQARELFSRLKEHRRSIEVAQNLDLTQFACRFMIFENTASDMIGTIEAALIKWHQPLWNTKLDGFGNHDPGNGRYQQAKSDWDVLHSGREWAERCVGTATPLETILSRVESYLETL